MFKANALKGELLFQRIATKHLNGENKNGM